MMAVYENNTSLICSTGDASNAREHALTFQATQAASYLLLLGSPSKPVTGHCPCTVRIYTPKSTYCRFVAIPLHARSNVVPRLPRPVPSSAPTTPAVNDGAKGNSSNDNEQRESKLAHSSRKIMSPPPLQP